MSRLAFTRRLAFVAFAALAATLLAGCVYSGPYPYPGGPSTFDRAFDAAVGAAADSGVAVSVADRGSGRIAGTKGGAAVTINVLRQADGSVRVEFNAPDSPQTSPTVAEQLNSAYQRRMGR
jgi:hypothetical protein